MNLTQEDPQRCTHLQNTQVTAEANIQGETVKSWVTSVLLAVSLVVNVVAIYALRDFGTQKWVHDWDLNQFINGPYVDTKVQLGKVEARLQAVEVSQACKR